MFRPGAGKAPSVAPPPPTVSFTMLFYKGYTIPLDVSSIDILTIAASFLPTRFALVAFMVYAPSGNLTGSTQIQIRDAAAGAGNNLCNTVLLFSLQTTQFVSSNYALGGGTNLPLISNASTLYVRQLSTAQVAGTTAKLGFWGVDLS